jgi:hypothetical protein
MTINDYIGALKEVYTDQVLEDAFYKSSVLARHIRFTKDFKGKSFPLPLSYASPGNGGALFSTAQANINPSKIIEWQVTRAQSYTLALIDRQTIKASDDKIGAFMSAASHEVKAAVYDQVKGLAVNLFGSGFGNWGQIATTATVASLVLQLADPVQARSFQVGDILVASATDGGTPRSGTATVTAVDRVLGTLSTSGSNWSTQISGLATGDFLARAANAVQSLNTATCIAGLAAWLPLTPPGSTDSFFSVNRSPDVVRLAGNRINGVGGSSLEEVINAGVVQVAAEGGSPDLVVVGSKTWAANENQLGSKIRYVGGDITTGEIGFPEVLINGPAGVCRLVMDQFCPSNVAYILDSDTWTFRSASGAPEIFDVDGTDGTMLRSPTADAYEVRVGYYGNLMCTMPGHNGVIQLS